MTGTEPVVAQPATRAPLRVGIIGCGNISATYLKVARQFERLRVVAVSDLDPERARARAEEFGVRAQPVESLLLDDEIEAVINLTVPNVHAQVSKLILEAGKHVYSEKPLATRREDGSELLELAHSRDLRIGCAPDTFLGAGLQTVRKLIDEGAIGRPVAATAFMMSSGVEMWHPDPGFFYRPGAGPLFDMGPYYLTALISFLGPIAAVSGQAATSFPERLITSKPLAGQTLRVETPTHITGLCDFHSGAVATLMTSFDVQASRLPRMEIYGSEGTIDVPDPNTFGGPVRLRRKGEKEWAEVPLTHGYTSNSRGLGLADMAHALASGRDHRANGELAYHVLDVMQSILEASDEGRRTEVSSSCGRPAPLPLGLEEGRLDD
ncbi:MAG TPA: Gfo/Idh/MocA family oxidoreductase [Trueperaceae bacterium]